MAIVTQQKWFERASRYSQIRINGVEGLFDLFVTSPYFRMENGSYFIARSITGSFDIRCIRAQGVKVGLLSFEYRDCDGKVTMKFGCLDEQGKTIMKTFDVVDVKDAQTKVSDIKVVGNGDAFQLLCKASSESQGWMKSTKAMFVGSGCLVQVSTQQRNPDGSYSIAEALTYAPAVKITDDVNGGRKLVFDPEMLEGP